MMMDGMPNIPNFKGLVTGGVDAAISFGGAALINAAFGNYWGVFNQYGVPIIMSDNVVSLSYENSSTISNAPIEAGSFANYNKVQDPYKATVVMSKGSGGVFGRGAFIAQLEALQKSTLLFHVITPEFVYRNANITGYSMAREASDGATLIKAALQLEEVREVKVKYEQEETASPDNAKNVDTGDKQAAPVSDTSLLRSTADIFRDGRGIKEAISSVTSRYFGGV